MAVLAAVSMATPTLLAAAPAAAAEEVSPPALSVPEPAPEPENPESPTGEGGASAGDPVSPGVAAPSQSPVAPEAGTSPAAPSASDPAEPTPGTPAPEQTGTPTTPPGTPDAGGETAPGGDTTPGGETRSASPAAVPRGAPKQSSTSQTVDRDNQVVIVPLGGALTATVLGLPIKRTPGSGWHDFTVRISNTSGRAIAPVSVRFNMDLNAWNGDDTRGWLTVQWYDEDAGVWKTMTDDNGAFYFHDAHFTDLAPGGYIDTKLRLKADASVPDSWGSARIMGAFEDEDGVWHDGLLSSYWFEIVAEGNKPPTKSDPSNGNKPAPHDGRKELPVTGKPTATGTSKPPATGTGTGSSTGTGSGDARPVAVTPGTADDSADRADSGATLAETGSDAASDWMVGAGSASIALGAALAAAARRRHRHTF